MNKSFDRYFNKRGVKNVTPVEKEDSDDDVVMSKLFSEISLEEVARNKQ
jgi:hypothetical protein